MPIFILISLILLLLVTVSLATMFWGNFSFAPWLPSKRGDLKRIFKLANLKSGEVFYDLGCGDGRIVFYAHRNFQVKSIGIEIALPLFLVCKIRQIFYPGKDIVFKYKNLFKQDLSDADLVYVFSLPKVLEKKLKQKLEKELKSGARVISYCFFIKGLKPKIVDRPEQKVNPIYLYQF